jgi:tetratricopeptide (TPR) repeat protein
MKIALVATFCGLAIGCASGPRSRSVTPKAAKAPALSVKTDDSKRELGIEMLQRTQRISFDDKGRARLESKRVFVIRSKRALQRWAMVRIGWRPAFEKRPIVEASVVSPGGKRVALDPATLSTSSVSQKRNVLSDGRVLRAPLPALQVGSTVHVRLVSQEEQPMMVGGGVHSLNLGGIETGRLSVEIVAPTRLPLRYLVEGCKLSPVSDRTRAGLRTIRFAARNFKPKLVFEHDTTPHLVDGPQISVSTVASWQQAARGYYQQVSSRLRDSKLRALLAGIDRSQKRRVVVKKLLARIHAKVRYTSLALGRAAIVPQRPHRTLARGYGDCKDKSALLVAALAELGIEAHMALVRSGSMDIQPALPGIDHFNHAIVYLPGQRPLWVDPGSGVAAPGHLPPSVQDRWALVIRPSTTKLIKTAASNERQNLYRETRTIAMQANGATQITEHCESLGSIGYYRRLALLRHSERARKKGIARYVSRSYQGGKLLSIVRDSGDDRYLLHFKGEGQLLHFGENAISRQLDVFGTLTEFLPASLKRYAKANPERKKRKHDLYVDTPFTAVLTYRLLPPAGFVLSRKPSTRSLRWGPARFGRTVVPHKKGRGVDVVYSLSVPRRFSPADVERFGEGFFAWGEESRPTVVFEHEGHQLLKKNKPLAAMKAYRQLIAPNSSQPAHRSLYALQLLSMGFRDEAVKQARIASGAEKKHWFAPYVLGVCLMRDWIGQPLRPGYARAEALAALRQAVKRAPDLIVPRATLAGLLQRDERGHLLVSSEKEMVEAVSHLEKIAQKHPRHSAADDIAANLLVRGKVEQATKWLRGKSLTLTRRQLWLASALMAGDGKQAVTEFRRLAARGQPGKLLFGATAFVLKARRYREMDRFYRALLAYKPELKKDKRTAMALALFQRLDSWQQQKRRLRRGPELVVKELVTAAYLGQRRYRKLMHPLSGSVKEKFRHIARKRLRAAIEPLARFWFSGADNFALDIFWTLEAKVEGDATRGYAVSLYFAKLPEHVVLRFFVAKHRGALRVVSHSGMAPLIAPWMQRQLTRRRYSALGHASRWLASQLAARQSLATLWDTSRNPTRLQVRAFVGGTLLSVDDRRGVKLLERALEGRLSPFSKRMARRMLAKYYLRSKAARRLMALLPRIAEDDPRLALRLRLSGWIMAKQHLKAERWARRRMSSHPRDYFVAELLASMQAKRGRYRDAVRVLDKLLAAKPDDATKANALNNRAWYALFGAKVGAEVVEQAERSNALRKGKSSDSKNTLAAVLAHTGNVRRAYRMLLESMDADNPDEADWFVRGRIAESLGLAKVAQRSYVNALDGPSKDRESSELAKRGLRRLKRLGSTGRSTTVASQGTKH